MAPSQVRFDNEQVSKEERTKGVELNESGGSARFTSENDPPPTDTSPPVLAIDDDTHTSVICTVPFFTNNSFPSTDTPLKSDNDENRPTPPSPFTQIRVVLIIDDESPPQLNTIECNTSSELTHDNPSDEQSTPTTTDIPSISTCSPLSTTSPPDPTTDSTELPTFP
ncbi:hypothetical protein BLNAU_6822 [Blattamonas nauphoetae]|uniref:Uncharacterized protein n=1 Tax=Blattamonas nauphoetae TaxID=2049346 RepID=A0ABQ9Y339_9EUKA|nr:hypothetical protein BLNAU_6822 [Blattamonas nauphoetae]